MSALLTREGLSDLLRREVLLNTPAEFRAAAEALRALGVYPTLPPMPVDALRAVRVHVARKDAEREAASAEGVLRAVADLLPDSSLLDGSTLYIGDQLVATALPLVGSVLVRHALVFDGFKHFIPEGCDTSVTKIAAHKDPVGRIVAAIELRQAARAKSLPVPAGDPGRDPEEVSHAA